MSLVMPDGRPQPAEQGQYQNPQYQNAYNQIGNYYQQYLGRPMSQQDFDSQTSGGRHVGQQNIDWARNQIYGSEEAQNFRNRTQPQRQSPSVDSVGTPPQNQPQNDNSVGGFPSAPNVPPIYNSGSNLFQTMQDAAGGVERIQSRYQPQTIRDFIGRQINPQEYKGSTFQQFSDPRNMGVQNERDSLLLRMLQNPESMNQTTQDQLFESQKDDALSFAKQLGLQQEQNIAGRGFSNFGNYAQQMRADQDNALMSELLRGRRDVATQAARQNFMDRLNTFGAAEQGLSGDVGRGGDIFRNILAGQQAQAQDRQFGAQFDLARQNAMAGNERENYASYLGGRGLQGQENARAEQFRQSAYGLSEQAMQNARQNALQAYLGQNNADLGWANYGLNADQQFLNFLQGL